MKQPKTGKLQAEEELRWQSYPLCGKLAGGDTFPSAPKPTHVTQKINEQQQQRFPQHRTHFRLGSDSGNPPKSIPTLWLLHDTDVCGNLQEWVPL